jgi:2-polyprenyl-3-methyl-5-hydroxy-6-metoxy-1,4-benzoquinol methylase
MIRGRLVINADVARVVDLNKGIPGVGTPDLIPCLEVLEHLIALDEAMALLAGILGPGGTIIASLPNIAHLRVPAIPAAG